MPNSPSQRSTRSGSNANALTLQDIKALIETSKKEILDGFKQEIDKLNKNISLLQTRVDKLDATNVLLASRCQTLEQKIQHVENQDKMMFEELCGETEERWKRRNFLMVSGLPELVSGSDEEHSTQSVAQRQAHDQELCAELFASLSEGAVAIGKTYRIGRSVNDRPKLLKVELTDPAQRSNILRKARSLRNSDKWTGVYINQDYTPRQQEQRKKLRDELRTRRNAGEDVVIYRGKIVPKSDISNFQ